MSREIKELYEFGEFRLDASRRLVSRGDEPVRVTSKALETLLVLVRNRARVVTKDELMQILWPDTFVEEVNLAQNISALRKALGEAPGENRYIATIPGKGYQFVCEVRASGGDDEVVVERHTRAQLVVMEEREIEEPGNVKALPAPRRGKSWVAWGTLAAVLVAGVAAGFWLEHRRAERAAEGTGHSVAVLPFQPLVPGGDEEHLGLGMADAVITKLSNIRQLPVRPTDVAIRYGDPGVDPLKAAREMGVDTVLTGRLQKVGDRVRVTVQLVRVSDGRALWAEAFDENYTNIFAVEDSISEKVAQALAVHLAGREKLEMQRHYTENIDAYRNYLKGRYEEFTFTPDGMYKAIEYFNQAIAEDPGYALAYAGLADAYTTESDWLLAPREALPKADTAARKALVFDDQLAEAHGALAHALLHEWRLKEADKEFHTALALNPGNVSTYFAYGEYLSSIGQADQAIATMQKGLTLDPLSPEINSFLAWDYYMKRDYESCLATSAKAIQMFPDFWVPHMAAGLCYYIRGEFEEGMREYEKALAMNPQSTFSQAGVAMCLAKSGKRAEARRALDQLQAMKSQTYVSPAYVGLVYLAMGDRDAAFGWMEKGYEDQAEWLLWLPVDPMFDGTRDDARFKELVRKVGI
jgi:TolB-like protein/DNA-binding winged helix-turn-helix (wHTH) protein/Tfp pilus assembly protein PilF